MIEELYERISDLRQELWFRRDTEELVKERLLHSSLSIEECDTIFYFLNMFDNKLEYEPVYRKTEDELFKILEVI